MCATPRTPRVNVSADSRRDLSQEGFIAMIISLKPSQSRVFICDRRFRVLAAGRRFGKTYLACIELCRAAMGPGRVAWYVAPTYKQAKRICWKPLKEFTRPFWASQPNETDLRIELITGGTIALRGADNYDGLRGEGLDFVVLDEFASMAPEAWTEVLRPALSDRLGGALFIGTPQGHNHFYELFQASREQEGWAAFQYTTEQGGIVPFSELEAARQELDERTYRQEYLASFENLGTGLAYYAFDRQYNVGPTKRNLGMPLFWTLDFNMNPLCSVLGQTTNGIVQILDELILPDSNTLAACEEFLIRTEKWVTGGRLDLTVYGDATGEQRQTSASRTDWQIVKNFFGRYPDRFRVNFRVPSTNPPVKDRINCVNAILRNHAGQHRLQVAPQCKQLIKDFEQVCWKCDPQGTSLATLDKSNPARTHASDALGYYIAQEFPMRPLRGERSGPMIY
jgi:Terminase large subunit, T4likevirus-type, N-terminal